MPRLALVVAVLLMFGVLNVLLFFDYWYVAGF